MHRARLVASIAGAAVLISVTAWLFAPGARGARAPVYPAIAAPTWTLPADTADVLRLDAFRRARVRMHREPPFSLEDIAFSIDNPVDDASAVDEPVACRYQYDEPSGTSSKFDCVLPNGRVVKVKYGRNPEIHGETAASALLERLGYAADHVRIVPRLRCYGCPRYPFFMSQVLWLFGIPHPLNPDGYQDGYTDFEWVSVESRFDAPAIESGAIEGWAWYELAQNQSPRAELDAFRLLAAFLAHWDNKSDNQRLVCLDRTMSRDGVCAEPLLMIQDLGATFGPVKVNLAAWSGRPVWQDRTGCRITMKDLPWEGATFPDAQISEAGRIAFAQAITQLTGADVRQLFVDARFHEFYSGSDDERDLAAWVDAFRRRADQVVNAGPCPH